MALSEIACVFPVNHIVAGSLVCFAAPSPAPWLDVHGTQDDRLFPFLATLTHDYLASIEMPASTNLLRVHERSRHNVIYRELLTRLCVW